MDEKPLPLPVPVNFHVIHLILRHHILFHDRIIGFLEYRDFSLLRSGRKSYGSRPSVPRIPGGRHCQPGVGFPCDGTPVISISDGCRPPVRACDIHIHPASGPFKGKSGPGQGEFRHPGRTLRTVRLRLPGTADGRIQTNSLEKRHKKIYQSFTSCHNH